MKNLNSYTVSQILRDYKELVIRNLNEVAAIVLSPSDIDTIRDIINKEYNAPGLYLAQKNNHFFNLLVASIEEDKALNTDKEKKLLILSKIYVKSVETEPHERLEEIKRLILGKLEYGILSYNVGKDLQSYKIIARDQEKSSEIKNEDFKELINNCLSISSIEDFKEMINNKYPGSELYTYVLRTLLIDIYMNQERKTIPECTRIIKELENGVDLPYDIRLKLNNDIIDYFKDNLQFLDTSTVLYNAAARLITGIKMFKGETIDGMELGVNSKPELKELLSLKNSIDLLRSIYKELSKGKYEEKEYSIILEDGIAAITIDNQKIKEFLDRCTQTDYILDEDITRVHEEIKDGIIPEDIDLKRIAGLNIKDLVNLNFSYIVEDDEEISNRKRDALLELANYLKKENIVDSEDLLNLYLEGNLSLELLQETSIEELTEEECNNRIIELYKEFKNAIGKNKKQEEENKLLRFASIYNLMKEQGKIENEELLEQILENSNFNAITIADDLYRLQLISMELAVEKLGKSQGVIFLIKQYMQGNFLPGKISRMYKNDLLDLDGIARLIMAMANNTEKYLAIGAIFPENTEEDQLSRDLLVGECLNIEAQKKVYLGGKRKEPTDIITHNKYVTDPFARLSVFKELDKDISIEMTADAHIIAKCPNAKKVIIEKMFDKKGEPWYGAATYVLTEEYYSKNEDMIYVDGEVIRQELTQNCKAKGVKPISHDDLWGENLKEEFGIIENEKNTLYTQEEIDRIDAAIKRVDESRKLR